MDNQLNEQALKIVKDKLNMSDKDLFDAFTNRMLNDDSIPDWMKKEIIKKSNKE